MQQKGTIHRGKAPSRVGAPIRGRAQPGALNINRRAAGSAAADVSATETTALYLADITDELARLARAARLDLLSYLLDMARLEASACARAAPKGLRRSEDDAPPPEAANAASEPGGRGGPAVQNGFQVEAGVNFR